MRCQQWGNLLTESYSTKINISLNVCARLKFIVATLALSLPRFCTLFFHSLWFRRQTGLSKAAAFRCRRGIVNTGRPSPGPWHMSDNTVASWLARSYTNTTEHRSAFTRSLAYVWQHGRLMVSTQLHQHKWTPVGLHQVLGICLTTRSPHG